MQKEWRFWVQQKGLYRFEQVSIGISSISSLGSSDKIELRNVIAETSTSMLTSSSRGSNNSSSQDDDKEQDA